MLQDTYNEDRNAFVNRQESTRQNALAAQQDTAKQAAGQQFAGGDLTGASNTLAASGNIAGAQQVQTYSDAQRQQHAEAAQRITRGIRAAVNAGHTPAEAYDMATQAAPAIGVDPAELQRMRPAFDKDPRGFLDLVDAQSKKALEPYTLSQGQSRYDANNKLLASVAPEQKYVTLAEGAKAVPIPGTGATPVSGASAPPPPSPDGPPVQTANPAAAVDGFVKANGGTITSGLRTAAHNAEVGGVPNSRHLTDQARDIVPPAGMTLAQLGANIQQQIPGAKVLVEKDHVHVQWGGNAAPKAATAPTSGDPQGTLYGNPKSEAQDTPLSKDAVELLAGRYLKDGTLPAMGMGKAAAANRTAILNRATSLAKGLGIDAGDLVAGNVSTKAAASALTKLTNIRSQVTASEHTVVMNADYAMTLAPKGAGPTGVPVLNRWIQAGRKRVAGDPDVAAFDQALGTVADEYAKVMTSSTGTGGVTSDSARAEAYRRLSSSATVPQLTSTIAAMKVEMNNRVASMGEMEEGLRAQIRGGAGGNQPGGAPVRVASPQEAMALAPGTVFITPDGRRKVR